MSNAVSDTAKSLPERIRALTDEVIAGTPYFIVDINVRGHKGSRVVEVYIDSDDELGHDDLAILSREIGFLLDVEDVVAGSYKLDVSSPGIKRPLTIPRQFRKHIGRTLRIKYHAEDDTPIVVGDLVDAGDEDVELELPSGEHVRVRYDDMERANFELPW